MLEEQIARAHIEFNAEVLYLLICENADVNIQARKST